MNARVAHMFNVNESAGRLLEKVMHVAFRCGCVRTLLAHETMPNNCPIHKENLASLMEEYRPAGHSGN